MSPRPSAAVQQTSIRGQVFRGDLAGVAEAKIESTHANLDPTQNQGHDGAPGRGRKGHPQRFQDGTQLRELLAQKWPLLKYCKAAARRRSSVSATVAPATAARYSRADSDNARRSPGHLASPTRSPRRFARRLPGRQLQGQAVQFGARVEGQGLRRRRGRLPVVPPRRARVCRDQWEWMARTSGSARPEYFQHLREAFGGGPRMAAVGGTWATTASRTSVVVGLDFVTLGRPGAADQPARPQEVKCLCSSGYEGRPGTRPPARAAGPTRRRPPGGAPCVSARQAAGRAPEHSVKDHKIGPRPSVQEAAIGLHVSREPATKQRGYRPTRGQSPRRKRSRRLVQAAQQGEGQALGIRGLQRPQSQHPAVHVRWGLPLRGR